MLKLRAPGSKSITQRLLIMGALSGKSHFFENALLCDDSQTLTQLLQALGHNLEWTQQGVAFSPSKSKNEIPSVAINCGAAGTTLRFGACLSLLSPAKLLLDGTQRLRERPLLSLTKALMSLGVSVEFLEAYGQAPIRLQRQHSVHHTTPVVCIDSSESSQFLSGLLMVAPCLPKGLIVQVAGECVSQPYATLTLNLMRDFGVDVEEFEKNTFRIEPAPYHIPQKFSVEADWSGAAFLLAALKIANVEGLVENLNQNSAQGDSIFAHMMREFENNREHIFDLTHTPDLIAPLAALAAFSKHPTTIRGASHARTKECDRVAVLARTLRQVGCHVIENIDGFSVIKTENKKLMDAVELNPEHDHRIAMFFGLLALGGYPVKIQDVHCVSKSFPTFWNELDKIRRVTT